MSLKKFLVKHAVELGQIADIADTLVGLLPIGRQDKERVRNVTGDLHKAAESIAKSAKKMTDSAVKIDKKQLKAVVEEMLPDIIEQVAEKVFEVAKKRDADSGK